MASWEPHPARMRRWEIGLWVLIPAGLVVWAWRSFLG